MKVLGLFYQNYGPYDSYFLIPRDHSMFTHVEINVRGEPAVSYK
jgi:hypothetical protein